MAVRLLRFSNNFRTLSKRFKQTHSHSSEYQAALQQYAPTELNITDNNIRVACQTTNNETTTLGIWFDAGSRYEESRENGVHNMIRHLAFKGTAKRAQAKLESDVANMGARLYSIVDREKVAFYGTCLTKDAPKLFEILSEAITCPKYDEDQINNIRKQLLHESDDIENSIKDVCFDYLHSVAYQGTPLAQNIIGTKKTIEAMTANDLKNCIDTHFKASRTVIAAAGGIQHSQLMQLADKHLSCMDDTFDGAPPILNHCRYTGSDVRVRDDGLPFACFAMGIEAPGWQSADRIPMMISNTIIDSYDRSLGKFADQSIYDICHSYESFYVQYSDTGLYGVYVVCEPLQCDEIALTVINNWNRICKSVTDAELDESKNRLITKLLQQMSSTKGNCEDIGNSILTIGRHIPLSDLIKTIETTNNQIIREVSDKYITNKCPVLAAIGPIEALSDYVNIRSRMYWART